MRPMKSAATTEMKMKKNNPASASAAAAEEEEEGKDLISELPDPIIHHILSFLDMKYVMRTSFLSKRWRFLWTSLTYLLLSQSIYNRCMNTIIEGRDDVEDDDDDDDDPEPEPVDISNFIDFIDRVLFLRDQSSIIQKFTLFCQDFHYSFLGHIYTWIRVLVRSKVEVIKLKVWSNYKNLEFPHCLFTCKTLRRLKLNMGKSVSGPRFKVPTDSMAHRLPALKFLHLISVKLMHGIEYLISNAPVLETLILVNCRNCVGNQLSISALQLKSLEIDSMFDENNEFDYSCFKVFAPKLISFVCKDFPINDYTFINNNTSLVTAIIEADTEANYYCSSEYLSKKQMYIKNAIKCLTGICHVRNLTLSARLLKMVTEGPADLGSLSLDKFCNLKVLKLITTLTKYEIHGITYFLVKCPDLETLEIEVDPATNSEEKDERWGMPLAPEFVMHNLKLIKIKGALANVNELNFLMFLLKNGTILEKMIVSISKEPPLYNNTELEQFIERLATFRERLATFPATSSKIEILILDQGWA